MSHGVLRDPYAESLPSDNLHSMLPIIKFLHSVAALGDDSCEMIFRAGAFDIIQHLHFRRFQNPLKERRSAEGLVDRTSYEMLVDGCHNVLDLWYQTYTRQAKLRRPPLAVVHAAGKLPDDSAIMQLYNAIKFVVCRIHFLGPRNTLSP
ncbi:hypothetical protein HGRIS_002965 [Hohenbuehelia grisea]|uniref:Uncharacterized protein n=1 Tax=Hohenbuehelia grisea TaxID=104357 RepID=A0ABR3JMW3_9AGAR